MSGSLFWFGAGAVTAALGWMQVDVIRARRQAALLRAAKRSHPAFQPQPEPWPGPQPIPLPRDGRWDVDQ